MEIILPILGSVLIFGLLLPFALFFEQVDAKRGMEQRRRVWPTSPMPQRDVLSRQDEYRRSQKILLSAFPDEKDLDLSCLNKHI